MFGNRYDGIVGFFSAVRTLEGRKKLQKAIYLAREHGFPGLREHFDFHWYGPYSEMLANEVQELVLMGVLREETLSQGYLTTYRYEINESTFKYFRDQVVDAQEYGALASRIVEEDTRFLELAASLHYFIRNGYDRAQAEREVLGVEPEKNYSPAEMERAWLFLDELKKLGMQPSEPH